MVPRYSSTTIASYELEAEGYNAQIDPHPPAPIEAALRHIVDSGAETVLEIGSGPGRDADYLEAQGLRVRRTDATQAFITLQSRRGKKVELLNVISDPLGGPYDAVLANCVLIHVDRAATPSVLRKIAAALCPGGTFLVSVREGEGELSGDDYHMTYWSDDEFTALLTDAGFTVRWQDRRTTCDDQTWLTYHAGNDPVS